MGATYMMTGLAAMLRRLGRDCRGNTMLIAAIALIPLIAMIGSAVDVSRAYMAKSKLQSACDSSALAARRVMKNDELDDNVTTTGQKYFRFNFPAGVFGTAEFEPEVTKPEIGVLRVSAETSIPNVFMQIFGFERMPIDVTCDASLNFVNTDVVLVLDVTGSMADPIDGVAKIDSLKEAVMALYDELAPVQQQLESQGLRLRYGIVPYSSTVNVGHLLYDANPDYLRTSAIYPSRVANFNQVVAVANTPTTDAGAWEYYSGSSGAGSSSPTASTRSTSQCQTWVGGSSGPSTGGGPAPASTFTYTYRGSSSSASYVASSNWGWSGAPVTTGTNRSCRRWKTTQTTTYNARRGFTNWTYQNVTYDLSNFIEPTGSILLANNATGTVAVPGGSFNAQQLAAAATGGSNSSVSWNGCIEERDTTTSIDGGTSMTIPSAALDLNINLIPSDDSSRWRPMFPDVVYTRTAGSTSTTSSASNTSTTGWVKNYAYSQGYWACPTEARRLTEWTRDELEGYISGLQTVGGTYHDIGMIWGARMISTEGVFADGCDEYNGMPCNRHIIFMTDGAQTAYCNVLTAYGVEQNDMRVTGAGNCPSQLARHQQRFRMACNAAKNMNTSVWVIGFDTSLNSNLTGCASNASQASTSSDRESLIERFRQIGNQIGALRLVK
jgi:Flp pilus assembly protein TadG